MGSPAKASAHDVDALEFELTDLDTARQALEALPAGVEEVQRMRPGYWDAYRRRSVATDRALAGGTLEWLIRLPAEVRPTLTAERYPRIVNHIAETWMSALQCQRAFDELLCDTRGGRRGFPFEVESELRGLKRYRASLGR